MKKRIISLLAIASILIITIPLISSEVTIAGHATSQPTNVSVFVLPPHPILKIISPTETIYTENEYILLDYSAVLIDTVWYNIDNSQNTTINQSDLPFYFKESKGTHTLYLYGNTTTNGTILSDNVTFQVQKKPSAGRAKIEPEKIEVVVDKEVIELSLEQGQEKQISVFVKNNEEEKVNVQIENLDIGDFITSISRTELVLEPGQQEEILITFKAENDTIPEVYLEKILIKTIESEKEISFYVEVQSKDVLFDVDIFIPEDPAIFYPEENLTAQVLIYNLGQTSQTEVRIEYIIKNPETNKVTVGEEQTLIITKALTNITKSFTLPIDIDPGNYVFYVKALYDSKTASASKWFKVIPISPYVPKAVQKALNAIDREGPYLAIAIFSLTSLFIGLTVSQILAKKYNWFKYAKNKKTMKKTGSKKIQKEKSKTTKKNGSSHQKYKKRIKSNLKKIKGKSKTKKN